MSSLVRDLCLKCRQRGHFARDCPGLSADVPAADVPTADASSANVSATDVPSGDVSGPPVPLLQAVTSLVRNAVGVADFRQPLASQEVISSILARGAARRRPVPVGSPSSDVSPSSSTLLQFRPAVVLLLSSILILCHLVFKWSLIFTIRPAVSWLRILRLSRCIVSVFTVIIVVPSLSSLFFFLVVLLHLPLLFWIPVCWLPSSRRKVLTVAVQKY